MNQASIFTLGKSGNSYKDFEVFPRDIYVDTSAWLAAYSSSLVYNPVKEFMADCIDNGTTLYHSGLVMEELMHVNEKAHYEKYTEQYKKQARNADRTINYKKANDLIRIAHPEIEDEIFESQNKLLHIVQSASEMLEYVENTKTIEEIIKIRKASGNILGVHDAKHVYIARSYGINSFLTADKDFIALDNDNIFAPNNEKFSIAKMGRANCLLEFDSKKY